MQVAPSPAIAAGISAIINNQQFKPETTSVSLTPKYMAVRDIIVVGVCAFFNTTAEAVMIKSRKHEFCQVRQFICYYLHEKTNLTLNDIAIVVNRASHATILHSYRTIKHLIEFDKRIRHIHVQINQIIDFMIEKTTIIPSTAGDAKIALRAMYSDAEIMQNEELENLYRDVCTIQAFGDDIPIRSKELLTLLEKHLK